MDHDENTYQSRSERIGRILMVWSALGLFLLGLLLLLIPLRTQAESSLFPMPGKAADNGGAIRVSHSADIFPKLGGRTAQAM